MRTLKCMHMLLESLEPRKLLSAVGSPAEGPVLPVAGPFGTAIIEAAADTFVSDRAPNRDFSENDRLLVKAGNHGLSRRTLIQFNIADLSSGSNAYLRLFGGHRRMNADPVVLNVHILSGDPNTVEISQKSQSVTGPLGSLTVQPGPEQWHVIDVTEHVASAMAAGWESVGFLIESSESSNSNVQFHSLEAGAKSPQLVLSDIIGGWVSEAARASARSASIELTWSELPGAEEYRIYRSEVHGDRGTLIGSGLDDSFTDTPGSGFEAGTEYFYSIEAIAEGLQLTTSQLQVSAPLLANSVTFVAPFAQPNEAIATSQPNDPFDNFTDNEQVGTIGVPQFHPQWGTLAQASGEIDWVVRYAWEVHNDTTSPFNVGAQAGYISTQSVTVFDRSSPNIVGAPGTYSGRFDGEGGGSVSLRRPLVGNGLQDIDIRSKLHASVGSTTGNNEASISGFFSGFFSVTYIFTTP